MNYSLFIQRGAQKELAQLPGENYARVPADQ